VDFFLQRFSRSPVLGIANEDGGRGLDYDSALGYADFQSADEIFSSGNFSKLTPITRIDDRALQPGPFYRQARQLYWDFAHR